MKTKLSFYFILILIIGCKTENNFEDDVELCEILSEMTIADQKIRKLQLFKKGSKKQKDSLWKIQKSIDKKNTELLIEITEKRGWVSMGQFDCEKYFAPVLIFRHSPKEYWNELGKLIEKEKEAERMDGGDFMFIKNHLEGRPVFNFGVIED